MTKALLVLKDGTSFEGISFGYKGEEGSFNTIGEVVFNTSMTGYQEILTDPSYKWQMVCMTYPEIGNYGVNFEDLESEVPQVAAMIVKDYNPRPSNFRSKETLSDYLKKNKIPALEKIDTRSLVKHLRDKGAMSGILAIGDFDPAKIKREAKKLPTIEGMNLAKEVSCKKSYSWKEGVWELEKENDDVGANLVFAQNRGGTFKKGRIQDSPLRIIAYDFGIKRNILRNLVHIGFDVTVVPSSTSAKEIFDLNPDGVFLSNGPGDPAAVTDGIENVSQILGKIPTFGICLGHQIMSLALGAKTYKMKFGHRGGNQPVMDLSTGKVEITAQNHGFASDEKSLKGLTEVTHLNLNDKTVEGLADLKRKFFSVQYHPEASPGPHDSLYLFERFRKMIES